MTFTEFKQMNFKMNDVIRIILFFSMMFSVVGLVYRIMICEYEQLMKTETEIR